MKYFVTVADDFGFTSGINKGVLEAYKNGFLKEMSLMVNSPGTDEAVKLAKENNITSVGLHITLTNLNNDGIYLRSADYLELLATKPKEYLIDLVKREIDEFIKLIGRLPSHINSHQYSDRHEKIYEFVAEFCSANKIPTRNPFHIISGNSGFNDFNKDFIESTLERFPVFFCDHAESEIPGELEPVKVGILQKLSTIKDGESVEFAFHPGYVDETLIKYTSLQKERERDVKILTNIEFQNKIEKMDFEIVSYKELVSV